MSFLPPDVASDRVYTADAVTCIPVGSYSAFSSLPTCVGGCFLLHFPASFLGLPLAVILPYEARTFLTAKTRRCHTVGSKKHFSTNDVQGQIKFARGQVKSVYFKPKVIKNDVLV